MIAWFILFVIFVFLMWYRFYFIPNAYISKNKRINMEKDCNVAIVFNIVVILIYYFVGGSDIIKNFIKSYV